MDKITQCYICNGTNLGECIYNDWDDEVNVEVLRQGYFCNDCETFHYEENDRVICIIAHKEETTSSLNGYIHKI